MIKHNLKARVVHGILRWVARIQYDWRDAADDIAKGIHSKIPTCCVAFFVTEWVPWVAAYGQNTPHPHQEDMLHHGLTTIEHAKSGKPPQYVPCPDCLRNKSFVEIHECTDECANVIGGLVKSRKREP